MTDCIFCKIVAGQIPAQRVFESGGAIAFLDIAPVARGHVLVIPKVHAQTLDQLPADAAATVGAALVKVGGGVAKAVGAPAWNVLQNNGKAAGQVVPHVHFHIIPRFGDDAFHFTWPASALKETEGAELYAKITEALR